MNEIPAGVPEAAPWSMIAGQMGTATVWASIFFFVLAALWMAATPRSQVLSRFEKVGTTLFILGCVSLFVSFGALALLFAKDQFQYAYVREHSEIGTTLPYKIASVWTAQQGSFLLWACGSAAFALLALKGTGPYRRAFVGSLSIFLASLGGILSYETPFRIIENVVAHGKTYVPTDGLGMVPSLQNYWVIIHPPTIFLGFGSLCILAAYAIAAMIQGDAKDWVLRVRPWVLVSTAILGLGISMGGLWAYETQGWGGFWAWDPVENVSFVPWLFVVVLAHGLIVQASRGKWVATNLILAGAPFLAFVYGTYLTRSGLLDKVSVHSFASMDEHARGILKLFLIAAIALYAGTYLLRGRSAAKAALVTAQPEEPGTNRESLYRYSMLLLGLMSVVIGLGMSWPVITALRGGEGSAVKEPLYHLVVVWFFLPLMALMAITPFVSWKQTDLKILWERLFGVVCISIGLTGVVHLVLLTSAVGVHAEAGATVAAPFGRQIPLALWMLVLLFSVIFVIVANFWRAIELARRSAMGTGGFVSHLGIAVLMGGLILSRGYERKASMVIREGHPDSAMGYTVSYKGMSTDDFFNRDRKVEFEVKGPSGERFIARPGHYRYRSGEETKDQVWPAIERFSTHDVYVSMAPPVVFVTPEPILIKPGESKDVGGSLVEYLSTTRKGEFGQMGTKFGASIRLTETDDKMERRQYVANPEVELTPEGLSPTLAQIGPNFRVALMGPVNPADKSVQLALMFNPPIYPIELFEKPFTGLVWLGTGILTLGGLMSAFARRRVSATCRKTVPSARTDAPLPAPQS